MNTQIIPIPHKGIKNITGKVYGRLTVLGFVGVKNEFSQWLCRCECGNETIAISASLNRGSKTSCGCYYRERHREATQKMLTTHGKSKTPEFQTWKRMRQRCLNPQSRDYTRYGGRGIRICDRWNDFALFLDDMGCRPSPDHSLDRIDNNGDYCPENCRWATDIEQANNKRINKYYEHDGRILTMKQWADEYGINYQALVDRLEKGMSISEALTKPIAKEKRNKVAKNLSHNAT